MENDNNKEGKFALRFFGFFCLLSHGRGKGGVDGVLCLSCQKPRSPNPIDCLPL